ncbi:MAG: M6 family metalloprotease domain-containing protein [Bacteroidales bacterium]|nr:M6 family metalloprotease domain-containing protein [Bacteroidales bacterium]
MKKFTLSLIISAATALSAYAVPAHPYANRVLQPDGTSLTVRLIGDEYLHYSTTDDGYTILKNNEGYYVYAVMDNGQLTASTQIAQDASARSTAGKRFLCNVSRNLRPSMSETSRQMLDATRKMQRRPLLHGNGKYDIQNFKGLIILVEFNDLSFSRDDIRTIFNDMVNKRNFDGFMSNSLIPEKMEYTGSVRDYYYDNSMGKFDPQFDVVGPVKIDFSKYSAESSTNGRALTAAAVRAVDSQVDFSEYDRDKDGTVDMVYFVFAGYGANFSGNDSRLIWPHASTMFGVRLDGVALGRYACSTEMWGREGTNTIDGIGTICHEFSHVLGLPDEYDTDYAKSGGQSVHPQIWSLMAGGSYRNKSRTPVAYTLYERYALGFASPILIDKPGDFKLGALNTTNEGYRINSAMKDEFFLIENRQMTGWDAYLPGHGMIVTRVDSTNVDVWENNQINVNPAHNYLEMLRAKPSVSGTTVTDSEGDPFPGSGNVTEITNDSDPSLRSWTGTGTPLSITDISENADGSISFATVTANILSLKEDFEAMDATDGSDQTISGKFCTWTLGKKAAISATQEGYGNGTKALTLVKKSEAITSQVNRNVSSLSFNASNSAASMAIIRCYYSTDGGNTWVSMKNVNGVENNTIAGSANEQIIYNIPVENPCFKITQTSGSGITPCYIDDVVISYEESTSINNIITDKHESLSARCIQGNLVVTTDDCENIIRVYNINGAVIATAMPENGVATIQLPEHGFYVISQNGKSTKAVY